ncbi:MAG: hypothetical protein DRH17_02515 [Deltaproteobacteria bacterium]|nr:MAG: hypothetical protein DRH17_02515 [Deltaproteobacteria bacterium]
MVKTRAKELKDFYKLIFLKDLPLDDNNAYFNNWITGITRDCHGNIYLSDQYNSKIYKYDSNLCLQKVWGSKGSKNGQFMMPLEVIYFNESLYITDVGGGRIQIFDLNGNYKGKIDVSNANIDLNGAFFVTTDKREYLYIFVRDSSMLYVLDKSNKIIGKNNCNINKYGFINRVWCNPENRILYAGSRDGVIYDITSPDHPVRCFCAKQYVPIEAMVDFKLINDAWWFLVDHGANSLIKVEEDGKHFIWKNRRGWLLRLLHVKRLYVTIGAYGDLGRIMVVEV